MRVNAEWRPNLANTADGFLRNVKISGTSQFVMLGTVMSHNPLIWISQRAFMFRRKSELNVTRLHYLQFFRFAISAGTNKDGSGERLPVLVLDHWRSRRKPQRRLRSKNDYWLKKQECGRRTATIRPTTCDSWASLLRQSAL
jgi:hypothetical protein